MDCSMPNTFEPDEVVKSSPMNWPSSEGVEQEGRL